MQAAERARAAEERSRLLQDRQALAHAAAQEQGIQQRADARKSAAAAVAAENLQLIEARRAQARAQHFTAQRGCDDDGSFFERFGQSLS